MHRAYTMKGRAAAAAVALAGLLAACGGGGSDGGATTDSSFSESSAASSAASTTGAGKAPVTTSASSSTTAKAQQMPSVVGMTEAQAQSALSKVGITDIRVQKQENLGKSGTVLEQVPGAGVDADAGMTVNLIVAMKLPPMPDYTNRTLGDVRSWFEDRGVGIRTTLVLRDDLPDGTILSTTPAANEPISGEVLMQISEKPVTKQLSSEVPVEGRCNMSLTSADMSVNGSTLQNSIDMNSGGFGDLMCAIDFDLGRDWDTFKATVGLADSSAAAQSARFEVFVDGKPAFNQTVGFGQTVDVTVDVKNALRVQLRVAELGVGSVHGVWGNARVIGSSSATVQPSTTTSR